MSKHYEQPKAAKPDTFKLPTLTPEVVKLARVMNAKWRIPISFFVALCGVTTDYGRSCRGRNNYFNVKAQPGEACAPDGFCIYGAPLHSFDHLGAILTRSGTGDRARYSIIYNEHWSPTNPKSHNLNAYMKEMAAAWFPREIYMQERLLKIYNQTLFEGRALSQIDNK